MSKSSLSILSLISKIAITKSASLAISLALCIPIFSTSSSASLIPAVSIIFIGIPSIFINSSILSLVVPLYLLTMALSSLNKAFNSDDLPAFGFPTIAIFIPSFIIFPLSKVFFSSNKSFFTSFSISSAFFSVTSSISYSG